MHKQSALKQALVEGSGEGWAGGLAEASHTGSTTRKLGFNAARARARAMALQRVLHTSRLARTARWCAVCTTLRA